MHLSAASIRVRLSQPPGVRQLAGSAVWAGPRVKAVGVAAACGRCCARPGRRRGASRMPEMVPFLDVLLVEDGSGSVLAGKLRPLLACEDEGHGAGVTAPRLR